MSQLQVLDTLTIADEDGKILSTVLKNSPEGQVILAMQDRISHHEQDHAHPHLLPEATPEQPIEQPEE